MPRAIGEEGRADAIVREILEYREEGLFFSDCAASAAQSQSSSEERIGVLLAVFMEWIGRSF